MWPPTKIRAELLNFWVASCTEKQVQCALLEKQKISQKQKEGFLAFRLLVGAFGPNARSVNTQLERKLRAGASLENGVLPHRFTCETKVTAKAPKMPKTVRMMAMQPAMAPMSDMMPSSMP
mmetsp:Transcript_27627/g.51828  ORF Transcript_27627/g.51828 Transcript_27627/m.51828 type:complete len:121 (+) Transcript_27627:74-436(+)